MSKANAIPSVSVNSSANGYPTQAAFYWDRQQSSQMKQSGIRGSVARLPHIMLRCIQATLL